MPTELNATPVRLLGQSSASVVFLDNQNVIYISGRVVVILNLITQGQTFLPPRNSSFNTSFFNLSPDGQLLATLEVGPKNNVVIYEFPPARRRKAISVEIDSKLESYVALAFSSDGKILATLLPDAAGGNSTSNTHYTISLYLWRTGKVLASVQIGATSMSPFFPQLSFNPADANSMAVVYNGALRFYRLTPDGIESGMKPRLYGHVITCHGWITASKIVTGTTSGRALIFEEGDVISKIPVSTAETSDACTTPRAESASGKRSVDLKNAITAAHPFNNDYICYSVGVKALILTEALDSKGVSYKPNCTFSIPCDADCPEMGKCWLTMTLYQGKHLIAASCLGKIWLGEYHSHTATPDQKLNMRSIVGLAHLGAIGGLSIAEWCTSVVTVGRDRHLSLWNTNAEQTEFQRKFEDDILSVTIHPTGHYVAVTTSDSVQLFSVLIDRFHLIKELIVAGCQKLAFNSGGNWIAVTKGSILQLISFNNFKISAPMIAHKAEISEIGWSQDGLRLYSCGVDGLLCEWDLLTRQTRMQVKPNSTALVALTALPNGNIIVVTAEGCIIEVTSTGQVANRVRHADVVATCVQFLWRDQVVLVGTNSGSVRLYKYPLSGRSEYQEIFTQQGKLTHIGVTSDGEAMVTCCDDGSMCFWRFNQTAKEAARSAESSNECLVLRDDWHNQKVLLDLATKQLDQIQRQTQLQIQGMELDYHQRLSTTEKKFSLQLEQGNEKIMELETNMCHQAEQNKYQLLQLHAEYEKERQQQENYYQAKLANECRLHQRLENEMEEMRLQYDSDAKIRDDEWEAKLASMDLGLHEIIERNARDHEEKKNQLVSKIAALEAALKMTTDKAESDQKSLQSRHEIQLATEKQINLKLRGEAAILKKSIASLQKEVEIHRQASMGQQMDCQRLNNTLSLLKKDFQELHEELGRKDQIILSKDEKLVKLYDQIRHQEKIQMELKVALDDTKKKLHSVHIEDSKLQSKLKEAESDAKVAHIEVEQQKRAVEQMQGKARSQLGELQILRHKFQNQQSRLQEILVCLDVGMTYLHDTKQLKEYFCAVHEVYCGRDQASQPSISGSVNQITQWHRKVESLENTIISLRHQLSETAKKNRDKNDKLVRDNTLLLNELEQMRQSLEPKKERSKYQ